MLGPAILALFAFTAAGPQSAGKTYAAAIDRYVAGDSAAAEELLGSLSVADVEREAQASTYALFGLLNRSGPRNIDPSAMAASTRAARERLDAAAMLHTEHAMQDAVDDKAAMLHIDMAHLLLTLDRTYVQRARSSAPLLDPAETFDRQRALDYLPRWYAVATSVLLVRGLHPMAHKLVDEEARLFPGDPRMLFRRALVLEFQAGWDLPPRDEFSMAFRPRTDPSGFDLIANTRMWGPIVSDVRAVLAADSGNGEARLHLGYALYSMRRHDEARRELESVRDHAADPYDVYLADLFLARVEEDRQKFDAAARDYEHAVNAGPKYQSAYIALSLLEDRRGHHDAAHALIARFVGLSQRDREDDPWWSFRTARIPHDDLDWLRTQVRK